MHRLGTRKRYRSTVWQPSEHDTGLVDLLQYSFQQRQLPLQFRLRRAVRLPRDFIFKAALLASEELCCLFEFTGVEAQIAGHHLVQQFVILPGVLL